MKITTNFSTSVERVMPYLMAILLLLSAVAIAISIMLFMSARQVSAELPVLEEQLARFRSREISKPTDLLPYEKLVELRSRIQELNKLTNTSGQTLPLLFSRLEKLTPDGVWLVNLQYRSREDETKLVAEAKQAELLTQFMRQMERSGYFSQVLLTRQMQRSEGSQRAIQFEIRLRGKS